MRIPCVSGIISKSAYSVNDAPSEGVVARDAPPTLTTPTRPAGEPLSDLSPRDASNLEDDSSVDERDRPQRPQFDLVDRGRPIRRNRSHVQNYIDTYNTVESPAKPPNYYTLNHHNNKTSISG